MQRDFIEILYIGYDDIGIHEQPHNIKYTLHKYTVTRTSYIYAHDAKLEL